MVGIIKGKAFGSHPEVICGISQYHKYAYVHLICAEDCNHYDDQPMTERTHWEFRPSDFLSMFFFFFFCIRLGRDFINAALNNGFCAPFFYAPCQSETFYAPALDRFVQLSNSSKKKKEGWEATSCRLAKELRKKQRKKRALILKETEHFAMRRGRAVAPKIKVQSNVCYPTYHWMLATGKPKPKREKHGTDIWVLSCQRPINLSSRQTKKKKMENGQCFMLPLANV